MFLFPISLWPCWVAFARLFIRAVALETVVRQNRLYTATEINAAFASGSISAGCRHIGAQRSHRDES